MKILVRLLAFLLLTTPDSRLIAAAPTIQFSGPTVAGELDSPPRNEASGLAASRRSAEVLWTHDDSGGADAVYAVDLQGRSRITVRLDGVRNLDWEDLACVALDGKAWLVIGDIGDNDARRPRIALHFVEEPPKETLLGKQSVAVPAHAILRVTFEDGPRDCEALAVDARERAAYLLTKRELVPKLYRVALPPAPIKSADCTAELVGEVPGLARPTAADAILASVFEKGRARPCGMDFSPDGTLAVVVTYADVLVFPRRERESWAEALGRAPVRLAPHGLPQAEAVCFSRDGTAIYVASEQSRKLLRYDRK